MLGGLGRDLAEGGRAPWRPHGSWCLVGRAVSCLVHHLAQLSARRPLPNHPPFQRPQSSPPKRRRVENGVPPAGGGPGSETNLSGSKRPHGHRAPSELKECGWGARGGGTSKVPHDSSKDGRHRLCQQPALWAWGAGRHSAAALWTCGDVVEVRPIFSNPATSVAIATWSSERRRRLCRRSSWTALEVLRAGPC